MFFARFRDNNGEHVKLYTGTYAWSEYYTDTFNPETEKICLIEFKVSGKDYKSKQESIRSTAIDWSNYNEAGLFMSELYYITQWFYLMGKRYGLLQEFRENGII